jgi:hypothetical protein
MPSSGCRAAVAAAKIYPCVDPACHALAAARSGCRGAEHAGVAARVREALATAAVLEARGEGSVLRGRVPSGGARAEAAAVLQPAVFHRGAVHEAAGDERAAPRDGARVRRHPDGLWDHVRRRRSASPAGWTRCSGAFRASGGSGRAGRGRSARGLRGGRASSGRRRRLPRARPADRAEGIPREHDHRNPPRARVLLERWVTVIPFRPGIASPSRPRRLHRQRQVRPASPSGAVSTPRPRKVRYSV